jgi:hypothetical protein
MLEPLIEQALAEVGEALVYASLTLAVLGLDLALWVSASIRSARREERRRIGEEGACRL